MCNKYFCRRYYGEGEDKAAGLVTPKTYSRQAG